MPLFILHHISPKQRQMENIERGDADALASDMINAMLSGKADKALAHDLYTPVAAVECASIDDLFRITNHVDGDWATNDGVVAVDAPARSTSVGDAAYDLDSGEAWSCAIVGWELISDPKILARLATASRSYAHHHGVTSVAS